MTAMVVFGEDWDRHPSSTQHLVRRLAAERQVVWINSIGMRRPRLNVRDVRRAASKIFGTRRSLPTAVPARASLPPGLTVVSPLAVSWPGSRLAFCVNRELLARQIRPRLRERGIERPVLWTSLPTALPAVGQLGERAVVYYCGDDFGSLVGVDHEPVLAMEAALVAKADLVIAASEQLAGRFPKSKTLLVPHGSDFSLFANPMARAPDLPQGRPIAGFYGSLSGWIDVELLAFAARALPDWQLVLIGPVETDVSELRSLPNVSLLGQRDHGDLPSYVQHWTVSLMPFRDCPQIQACNPLKLREYLAAGREIVTTDFPALSRYRDLLTVASDRDAFVEGIRRSLEAPDRTAERRARVRGETWEARAGDVARALEAL